MIEIVDPLPEPPLLLELPQPARTIAPNTSAANAFV
jgi:hypothetical protein